RGKAGGVRVEDSQSAVTDAVNAMLGSQLVTHQTTAEGLPVNKVWIEAPSAIERELYLAVLVDRVTQRVVFMISAEGGMDIEEVAEKTPEAILTLYIEPVAGLQPYQ
ncbi:MAG TPA: succinate--CoA ligase subunit beta, partial [Methylophaga sp.]|nr:succinate--CoA ligase subunit beta [Methylophaga sp.]